MATEYTTSINELLKDTLPELPGVVRSVADREFRLTLRDFFDRTFVWTKTVKAVAIPTGETGIQVSDGDANTEVVGILNVAKGNTTDGYQDLFPLPQRPTQGDNSTRPEGWFVSSNPDEIVLYPYLTEATTDNLNVVVALKPAADIDASQNTLPRQIILKYYDAIMEGFLARMYEHPNKPYSAPATAQQKRHNYLRAIGYYAAQRKQGYNGTQNWVYPQNWR